MSSKIQVGCGFFAERREGGAIAISHEGGGLHIANSSERAMVNEIERLRSLLRDCSEKLLLYYKRDASYVGGIEHSQLQSRIDAALAEQKEGQA